MSERVKRVAARRKLNNESRERRPISIYGENVRATQPIARTLRASTAPLSRIHVTYVTR